MIELIKRNTKSAPLSWNDLDENWGIIEDALNTLGNTQLYVIENVEHSHTCSSSGTTVLNVTGRIRLNGTTTGIPLIKGCVTMNNTIVKAGETMQLFLGNTFPLPANAVANVPFYYDIDINADEFPAKVVMQMWDEKGNFSLPHELVIAETSCVYLSLVSCSVGLNMTDFTRTVNFVADANGSGSYVLQYQNATGWQNLVEFVHTSKRLSHSYNLSNDVPSGILSVRLYDSATGVASAVSEVDFSFADWYAWHLFPSCDCDGGQKLTIAFNIAKMPSSSMSIEAKLMEEWIEIERYDFAFIVDMPFVGGGTISMGLPSGTYDIRARNLLTGKILLAEDVLVPSCAVETPVNLISANIICNTATGYLRKLTINITTAETSSGNFKVQHYNATTWADLHEFTHTHGSFEVDFYLPMDTPISTYNVRVVDIDTTEASNELEVAMYYADTYEWNVEPNTICDGTQQKLQVEIAYENTPAADLLLEVYNGSSWTTLASYEASAGTGTTSFAGPVTIDPELVGSFNVRVLNSVTGSSLLISDIAFATCTV